MVQKLCFLFIIFFGAAAGLFSQPYISASAGYGFSDASGITYRSSWMFMEDIETHGSYGQGNKFSIAPGYMLNHNLGFELEATYSKGHTFSVPIGYNNTAKLDYFSFAPMFVMRTNYGCVAPYIKFGGAIAYSKLSTKMTSSVDGYEKAEFTEHPAFGFTGRLGVEYKLQQIGVFIEGGYTALSWQPGRVQADVNLTHIDIKIVDADPALEGNEARPEYKFPISSFTVMLGLRYEF
jgi:opacity protein-like surface antigen